MIVHVGVAAAFGGAFPTGIEADRQLGLEGLRSREAGPCQEAERGQADGGAGHVQADALLSSPTISSERQASAQIEQTAAQESVASRQSPMAPWSPVSAGCEASMDLIWSTAILREIDWRGKRWRRSDVPRPSGSGPVPLPSSPTGRRVLVFRRIDQTLTAWQVAALWVLALAALGFLNLVPLPELDRISGGLGIFDTRMTGYSVADATEILTALGEPGRRTYRNVELPADFLLAPLLFLAQVSLFLRLTRPAARFSVPLPDHLRLAVVAAALVAFLADWGENAVVLALLLGPAHPAAALVGLGSALTTFKTGGLTLSLAALLATLLLAVSRGLFAPVRRSRQPEAQLDETGGMGQ